MDAHCRGQREARGALQFGNRQRSAVAHRRAHLGQRGLEAVLQWTGIGNIAVDAFFEREVVLLVATTDIVALPVACAVAAFTPVLFDDRVVES